MKNKCGWCAREFENDEKHYQQHGNRCFLCVGGLRKKKIPKEKKIRNLFK